MKQRISETYSEPSQTSKMELFVKIVKSWNPLSIFAKSSIIDVWQCSEDNSEFSCKWSHFWRGTDIPNTKLNESVTEWYRCGKCGAMEKNVQSTCVATK